MSDHGLDWLAMATSLLAVTLLGQKNRLGFVSFWISNVIRVAVGVLAGSWGIVAGNVVFLLLNVRGFVRWSAPAPAPLCHAPA